MLGDYAGTVYLTADGVVGASGKPTRVYQVTFLSDGTARDLVLRNGIADTATVYVTAAGVISKSVTIDFGRYGILFPAGCFFDAGSVVSAVFTCQSEV